VALVEKILKRLFSRSYKIIERAEAVQLETNLLHMNVRATINGEDDWFLRLPGKRIVVTRILECREIDPNAE